MGTQLHIDVSDPTCGLRAYVVVDSLRNNLAMGGARMTGEVDLTEVADLAHAMTLKLALAGIPIGGAKAGITCGLPAGPERDRMLASFGRAVAPLLRGGIYIGADQGITYRDRDLFFAAANYDVCAELGTLPCGWAELWERCEPITGYGVCQAIFAAVEELHLACRTAVIQGFGLVGRSVARNLWEQGYRIVAVADRLGTIEDQAGLSVPDLIAATDAAGTIDRTKLTTRLSMHTGVDAWLEVPAQVLVLAAGGDAVREANQARVSASLVVEAGNLACTEAASDLLAARGIPVLPGIVANCGGATVTGLLLLHEQPHTTSADELAAWLFDQVRSRIKRNIVTLVQRGREVDMALPRLALELAEQRLAASPGGQPLVSVG